MPQRPDHFRLNMSHPLANGLVFAGLGAHAGSTRYHDSSLFGNHGTLTNMEPATDWVFSSSLNRYVTTFDGANEYAASTKLPGWLSNAYTTGLTISAWIAHTSTAARYCICGSFAASATHGFQLNVNSENDGSVGANKAVLTLIRTNSATDISVASSAADASLSSGNATHICATAAPGLASTGIAIYVNGNTKTMTASGINVAGAINDLTYDMAIAARNIAGTIALYYPGTISDLMIYGRVLSTSEIGMISNRSNGLLSGFINYPRRKWWPVVSGGTPAFKASWAARRRQVIGGGVL